MAMQTIFIKYALKKMEVQARSNLKRQVSSLWSTKPSNSATAVGRRPCGELDLYYPHRTPPGALCAGDSIDYTSKGAE